MATYEKNVLKYNLSGFPNVYLYINLGNCQKPIDKILIPVAINTPANSKYLTKNNESTK